MDIVKYIGTRAGIAFLILNSLMFAFVFFFGLFAIDLQWSYVGYMLAAVSCALFFYGFLRFKAEPRLANATMVVWVVIFLVSSHVVLGYREGTWRGFRTDQVLGWYPLSGLRDRPLEAKSGKTYLVTTDKRGHRNDHPYPETGQLDIVLQGDSNAFGFGLAKAQTFCDQLEKLLPRRCYNVGVPGYDLQHFYYQYQQIYREFRINTRIILLNVGNDYSMSALRTPYLLRRPGIYLDDSGNTVMENDAGMPFRKQVYGHHFLPPFSEFDRGMSTINAGRDWGNWMPEWLSGFRLAMFAFELVYPRATNLYLKIFDKDALEFGKSLNPYYPAWQYYGYEFWPQPFRLYWPHFEALVAEISKQPAKRIVVVMFPVKNQILESQESLETMAVSMGYPTSAVDRFVLQRMLRTLFEKHGIVVMDLAEDFMNDPSPTDFYQTDYHLSGKGIALVAKKVAEALR